MMMSITACVPHRTVSRPKSDSCLAGVSTVGQCSPCSTPALTQKITSYPSGRWMAGRFLVASYLAIRFLYAATTAVDRLGNTRTCNCILFDKGRTCHHNNLGIKLYLLFMNSFGLLVIPHEYS